jgi:hypothetical protein
MGGMALVVLGLFVLVWIISAVVKASQDSGPKRQPPARVRPMDDAPRVERTSNSDIDRFMAEIDRLRRKGEGLPAGRSADRPRPAPPVIERPKTLEPRRERDRDRRTRSPRPAPAPPPVRRTDPVPVLRPVTPEPPSAPPPPPTKPARPAKPIAAAVAVAPPSPVAQTIQSLLKSKQGPAAALILTEIFGSPRGQQMLRRPPAAG